MKFVGGAIPGLSHVLYTKKDIKSIAAGGAYAETVTEPGRLEAALRKGLEAVRNGRSAVIDVHMEPISNQEY